MQPRLLAFKRQAQQRAYKRRNNGEETGHERRVNVEKQHAARLWELMEGLREPAAHCLRIVTTGCELYEKRRKS